MKGEHPFYLQTGATLKHFYANNVEKNRNDIVKSYESEDYQNYTIFVHALKSTSKMIGANDLSETAKQMEQAGKDGNVDFIKSGYENMMKMYADVIAEIEEYLNKIESVS